MIKKTIILLATLTLTACGGSDSTPAPVACGDGIQSRWVNLEFDFVMDLRDAPLNQTASVDIVHESGGICRAQGLINSTNTCSGEFRLSNMAYVSGTGTGDPGCGLIATDTSYDILSNTMNVCELSNASDCFTYFRSDGGE